MAKENKMQKLRNSNFEKHTRMDLEVNPMPLSNVPCYIFYTPLPDSEHHTLPYQIYPFYYFKLHKAVLLKFGNVILYFLIIILELRNPFSNIPT